MNSHPQELSVQTQLNNPNTIVSKADQINFIHAIAYSKAEEAMNLAREAGELLLEVKKSLKHGEFQEWVEANCSCSVRQAQRYMSVALNKSVPIQELTLKNDTMSYLPPASTKSEGIWKDGKWRPERGCVYLFKDDEGSTYWVTPSTHETPHFHVCKHYSGVPMPTEGFYVGYTKFGKNDHEDLTSEFYVGTRNPLFGESGVAEVLKSYGLKDIKKSLVSGKVTANRYERPFAEPDEEYQYWSEEIFLGTNLGVSPFDSPETEPHPTGTPLF